MAKLSFSCFYDNLRVIVPVKAPLGRNGAETQYDTLEKVTTILSTTENHNYKIHPENPVWSLNFKKVILQKNYLKEKQARIWAPCTTTLWRHLSTIETDRYFRKMINEFKKRNVSFIKWHWYSKIVKFDFGTGNRLSLENQKRRSGTYYPSLKRKIILIEFWQRMAKALTTIRENTGQTHA